MTRFVDVLKSLCFHHGIRDIQVWRRANINPVEVSCEIILTICASLGMCMFMFSCMCGMYMCMCAYVDAPIHAYSF